MNKKISLNVINFLNKVIKHLLQDNRYHPRMEIITVYGLYNLKTG